MFLRILISCCLLAFAFCAPVNNNTSTTSPVNPNKIVEKNKYELLGGGFEGDMIFPNGFNPLSPIRTKGVAVYGSYRWPNRIIPYDISAISSTVHRNLILNAMLTLMNAVSTPVSGQTARRTCIAFRPRQPQDRVYVRIVYGNGCSATVGYWANYISTMTLQNPGCFYSGTIQHELMHVLGFYHEQSRPDRDSYITINYANIQSGLSYNFDKLRWGISALNQNTPYDYGSIMHYDSTAFSANGRATIIPKRSNVILGQRQQLSAIDIAEIRSFYGCS